MFSIRLLPLTKRNADNQRLGELVVGDFHENFVCHGWSVNLDGLEAYWRKRLFALIAGEPVVELQYDSRLAWVIYREKSDCFVQHRFSPDGDFRKLLPRVNETEDGTVSEWIMSVLAIEKFLG